MTLQVKCLNSLSTLSDYSSKEHVNLKLLEYNNFK